MAMFKSGCRGLVCAVLLLDCVQAAADGDTAPAVAALEPLTVSGERDRTPLLGEALTDRNTPQSQLSHEAIEQLATPLADYGTLANFTPSYVSSAPNGNSFDAAKNQTLRGFPDGQFNVTLDGIPFADPDSFGHHSTSYFPAAVLDHLVIDRSPGSATDAGWATIGGALNIYTLEQPRDASTRLYSALGNYATSLLGMRINTAAPKAAGETGAIVNVEHAQSNGVLANADGRKDDVFLKTDTLLGPDSRLTALYTFDRYHFNNPPNTTTSLLARDGAGSGFGATEGLPDFYGYNRTDRRSDLGYLRLQSSLGSGWAVDERLYTYSYANLGLSPLAGGDISATTAENNGLVASSPVFSKYAQGVPVNGIAGTRTDEDYRTIGNLLRVQHDDVHGTFHTGLWIDHSRETYLRSSVDLSYPVTAYTPTAKNAYAGSPTVADFTSHLDTLQPFVDYAWTVSEALSVRPGLRYQVVDRGLDAPVIASYVAQGYAGPVYKSYHSTLPSLDAHYRLNAEFDGFVELARGALVPNQNYFYTSVGKPPAQDLSGGNQARPQTSNAVQAGLAYSAGGNSLAVTVYHINFENYVARYTPPGGVVAYSNLGSVLFRGVELEGHAALGAGFTLAGNASLLRAEFQNAVPGLANAAGIPQVAGQDIPLVPQYTGFLGLLYAHGSWQASLLAKFVGSEYQGKNGAVDGPQFHVAPYSYANIVINHELGPVGGFKSVRLSLRVDNLFDRAAITDAAGPAADGSTLINVLGPRNGLLSLIGDF